MRSEYKLFGALCLGVMNSLTFAQSNTNQVTITTDSNYISFESNGIPNHETGTFPNAGNPNTISAQEQSFKVPANPIKNTTSTPLHLAGIALNGVIFEPGTAEKYEGAGGGDWRYEAFQDTRNLGLDTNNAHVQPTGKYHYHGVPTGFIEVLDAAEDMVHVGYAADGFKLYYSQSGAYASSYQIKSGTRPDGPGGEHDGTFTADFEYNDASGDLDECNAMEYNEEMVYMITEEFPYITRCLWGTMDESFQRGPGNGGGGRPGQIRPNGQMRPGGQGQPPMADGQEMSVPMQNGDHTEPRIAQNYTKFIGTLLPVKQYSDNASINNTQAVALLAQRGIMTGNPDGSFQPEKGINRAEALKTMLEALKTTIQTTTAAPFDDVAANQWYTNYVFTAKQNDIVQGNPDGSFKPSETVNQAELLKMTFKSFGIDIREANSTEEWYNPYIEYAMDTQLIDTPNPSESMSREAFAEVIYRLILQQENL